MELCSAEVAAECFALMVMLCDGLLAIRRRVAIKKRPPNRARFFRIASQLPLELQMVMCRRIVGSPLEGDLNVSVRLHFKD